MAVELAAGRPHLVHLRKDSQFVRVPDDPPRWPNQYLGIPPDAVLIAFGNSRFPPLNHSTTDNSGGLTGCWHRGRREANLKTPASEGEKQPTEQPKANPNASLTTQEAKAKVSQLLRNIFFRSGPVPMAPDSQEAK